MNDPAINYELLSYWAKGFAELVSTLCLFAACYWLYRQGKKTSSDIAETREQNANIIKATTAHRKIISYLIQRDKEKKGE